MRVEVTARVALSIAPTSVSCSVRVIAVCVAMITLAENGLHAADMKKASDAAIYVAECGGGRAKATMIVPSQYGADSKWTAYINSVDKAGILADGVAGPSGTVRTLDVRFAPAKTQYLYLVVRDGRGNLMETVASKVEASDSLVASLFGKYGGVLIGAVIGLMSTGCAALTSQYVKQRNQERVSSKRIIASISYAICELETRWDSNDRSFALSELVEGNGLDTTLAHCDQAEELLNIIQTLRAIHSMWRDGEATVDQYHRLGELKKRLARVKRRKWFGIRL